MKDPHSSHKPKPGVATAAAPDAASACDGAGVADAAGTEVRFRLRIRHRDLLAIGPGKVDLLEAIREHGSIAAAARSMGMSYRRAWLLIDELNRALREPATHSGHGGASGGGSGLTPVGERIVTLYRDIEATAQRACARQLDALLDLLER
ncbi:MULTISPECIES: winged helix-turn-helix domain-containing protein [unclassified Achromobacter]|uniref:winged helix-turn-helix domain-containing protein n=1 Tax=unclassified Achromobacter TaxID=2626865 RepID=UPI000B51D1E9|nr:MULTISPECIES: LysR family transcriptional regulator [unclassified Achromobacter]OWT80500.1 ModE family transcriptional regulator [Achromobacter sp. HZ34]OWT82383.1 ModE family transcriptional regulator [Achromobacter sp. HZ28]